MLAPSTRRTRIVLFLLVGAGRLAASPFDPPVPSFERVELPSGPVGAPVWALEQDAAGYLWLGTRAGLERYDGVAFRRESSATDGTALGVVASVRDDGEGGLWVGSETAGLFRRRPNGILEPVDVLGETGSVEEVLVTGGRTWVLAGSNVYLRGGHGEAWKRAGFPRSESPEIQALVEDAEGAMWAFDALADPPGLWRWDRDGTLPVRYDVRGEWTWWAEPAWGPDGRLWASSRGPAAVGHDPPRSIVPEDSLAWHTERVGSDVWIYDPGRLFRVHPGESPRLVARLDERYPANSVQDLLVDRAGVVWLATLDGLFRWDPRGSAFRIGSRADAGLPDEAIFSAAVEADGRVWVGTAESGLFHLEPDAERFRPFDFGEEETSRRTIYRIVPASGGDGVWVGSWDRLCRVRAEGEAACREVPSWTGVQEIVATRDGPVWFSGAAGPCRAEPVEGSEAPARIECFPIEAGDTDTGGVQIRALVEGGDGALWIGLQRGELLRFDPTEGTVLPLPPSARTTAGGAILALLGDADGLWVGAEDGLWRHVPGAGLRERFDVGAAVHSLLRADDGRLWIGTARGIVRLDPTTGTMRRWGSEDGALGRTSTLGPAVRLADGRFFFGGSDGWTVFDPGAVRDDPFEPPVRILTATIEGVEGARTLEDLPDTLVTDHRHDTLQFRFAALSFSRPERNRTRYRLDGHDPAWVDAGLGQGTARYARLRPGHYVFRVEGANHDGVWSSREARLPIVVEPPFWETWPFRLVVLAVVGALGVAAYRLRVARLLELERLRLRIAGDLHDDLSSNLSGIALLGDALRRSDRLDARDRERVVTMAETARGMVGDLRDIVWLVDPSNDGTADLVAKLRDVARALLPDLDVRVEAEGDLPEGLAMERRRQVLLLAKEALHNVARHAEADRVSVFLRTSGSRVELEVRDDGRGFDPEAVPRGHGLDSMRRRARRAGGSVEVETRPGAGTVVRFSSDRR